MNTLDTPHIAPYRVLFPLGFFHAVVGASYWVLHALGFLEYPGVQHAHEMFTGFLLSFAAGFLLTAIPRFTGAQSCTRTELSLGAALSLLTFSVHSAWLTLTMLLFLASFFFRRFMKEGEFSPPPHFVFLPVGLTLGLSGSAILTLIEFGQMDSKYLVPARLILYSGTMLAFLLGIGAKLISALLGWSAPPTHHQIQPLHKKGMNAVPFIQAGLFLLSFALEIGVHPGLGKGLRAACATWIALQNWKLHHRPLAQGKLPFWIWVTGWLLLIGLWIQAFFPSLGIHASHLTFVMGFALIVFMVASRVTLAHGGYPLECESKSKVYAVTAISLIIAGTTRFIAVWTASYTRHLGYAAITFIFGLGVWGYYFLPKLLRRYDEKSRS